jgi:hypothetical protein
MIRRCVRPPLLNWFTCLRAPAPWPVCCLLVVGCTEASLSAQEAASSALAAPTAAPVAGTSTDPAASSAAVPAAQRPSVRSAAGEPSPWEWRLEGGLGFARETLHYTSAATVANSQTGYASTSTATTASASTAVGALEVTVLRAAAAAPGSRGGLLWGASLALADYGTRDVALPVADADVSASTRNGSSFTSRISLQSLALGMPLGWAWDYAPGWSLEGLASVHLGIMHVRYTSGENEVFGRNAPLGLYRDSLYNLYYDFGAQLHLAYHAQGGWAGGAGLGYRFGRSLAGSHSDQVVYYQGAANAQPGGYQERLSVTVSAAYLVLGCTHRF